MKRLAAFAFLALAGCENGQQFDLVCDGAMYQRVQIGSVNTQQKLTDYTHTYSVDLKRNAYCYQIENEPCSESRFEPIQDVSAATLTFDDWTKVDRTTGEMSAEHRTVQFYGVCTKARFTPAQRTQF